MKELSIEQKAKRYDETIEKLRNFHRDYDIVSGLIDVKEELANLFPELRASEDERIRGAIIDHLKDYNLTEWAAWLEKQGRTFTKKDVDDAYLKGVCNTKQELEKQGENHIVGNNEMVKPIDKVEPKFKVGDSIKTTNEELLTITKIDDKGYWSEDLFICGFDDTAKWELVEQEPAWSEEDEVGLGDAMWAIEQARTIAKDENDMGNLWYAENWLKSLKNRVQPQLKQEWKQENAGDLTDFENAMMHIGASFFGQYAGLDPNDTNSIKGQANLLLELVPKQEWSEEDESYLNTTIAYLKDAKEFKKTAENCIDWLKSIRPKNRLEANRRAIRVCKEVYADILSAKGFDLGTINSELNRLEEQLKKL